MACLASPHPSEPAGNVNFMNKIISVFLGLFMLSPPAMAGGIPMGGMIPAGHSIPLEFILFGITLLGIAIFHSRTLEIAATGAIVIAIYKIAITGFKTGNGLTGFLAHLGHEWVILANLLCLLAGFAILSRHFEKSQVPTILPKYLPEGWKGGFVLLALVFVMSGFLDNIAAALIGGAMAHQLFRGKVHVGYLAAMVAASNAGGAGSVAGDTTTTMIWISGVSPTAVLPAYLPSAVALLIVGFIGAKQQHSYSPIVRHTHPHVKADWGRLFIVSCILVLAIGTNVAVNIKVPELADHFPFIGIAVWTAILLTARIRKHDWHVLPDAVKGAGFLLSLVLCASMMPVDQLPKPTWLTTLGLGFVSSVFDNIPLTALAIKQGGYDWGMLAYAAGFGGSMVWFGSSSGIALSNMYPEIRSTSLWLKQGWHVIVAYVAGFFVMLAVFGWNPDATHALANQDIHPTASQNSTKMANGAAEISAPSHSTNR